MEHVVHFDTDVRGKSKKVKKEDFNFGSARRVAVLFWKSKFVNVLLSSTWKAHREG
jgi:hypothetical protein